MTDKPTRYGRAPDPTNATLIQVNGYAQVLNVLVHSRAALLSTALPDTTPLPAEPGQPMQDEPVLVYVPDAPLLPKLTGPLVAVDLAITRVAELITALSSQEMPVHVQH